MDPSDLPQNRDHGWDMALRPLAVPVFRRFWIASMISNFGTLMQTVAAAWLMTAIAGNAQMVALVQTAASLPMMLFAMLAGTLADIVDRRRIMIMAQTGMALVAAALAASTIAHWTTPTILLGATFLIATGNALYAPAWQASVVEQVDRPLLEAASSLNSVGFNVARSIGPAAGGTLVALAGSGPVFALNALSYLGLLFAAISWKRQPLPQSLPPERVIEAIQSGLRYAWLSPELLTLAVRSSAFGFCGSCVWALTPVLARNALHGGALTLGLLLGGFGAGSVLGAVLRANLDWSRAALLYRCSLLFGVATIALSQCPWVIPAIFLMILIGAAWVMVLTSLGVSVQIVVPRWVVGRMIAINQMAVFTGMAVGSFGWGYVATAIDVRVAFLLSGFAMIFSLILGLWFLPSDERGLDLSPARDVPLDRLDGPIRPGDGPIVITLDYEVAAENFAAFSEAMEALGRVRRRDGAQRWSLQQDMDAPHRWIERFISSSWITHLRRQVRPTVADQAVRDRVTALTVSPPIVRRTIERSRGDVALLPEEALGNDAV